MYQAPVPTVVQHLTCTIAEPHNTDKLRPRENLVEVRCKGHRVKGPPGFLSLADPFSLGPYP